MPIKFSGHNFFKNLRNINKFTIDGTQLYFAIHRLLIINVVLCYSILQHVLSFINYLFSHKN